MACLKRQMKRVLVTSLYTNVWPKERSVSEDDGLLWGYT